MFFPIIALVAVLALVVTAFFGVMRRQRQRQAEAEAKAEVERHAAEEARKAAEAAEAARLQAEAEAKAEVERHAAEEARKAAEAAEAARLQAEAEAKAEVERHAAEEARKAAEAAEAARLAADAAELDRLEAERLACEKAEAKAEAEQALKRQLKEVEAKRREAIREVPLPPFALPGTPGWWKGREQGFKGEAPKNWEPFVLNQPKGSSSRQLERAYDNNRERRGQSHMIALRNAVRWGLCCVRVALDHPERHTPQDLEAVVRQIQDFVVWGLTTGNHAVFIEIAREAAGTWLGLVWQMLGRKTAEHAGLVEIVKGVMTKRPELVPLLGLAVDNIEGRIEQRRQQLVDKGAAPKTAYAFACAEGFRWTQTLQPHLDTRRQGDIGAMRSKIRGILAREIGADHVDLCLAILRRGDSPLLMPGVQEEQESLMADLKSSLATTNNPNAPMAEKPVRGPKTKGKAGVDQRTHALDLKAKREATTGGNKKKDGAKPKKEKKEPVSAADKAMRKQIWEGIWVSGLNSAIKRLLTLARGAGLTNSEREELAVLTTGRWIIEPGPAIQAKASREEMEKESFFDLSRRPYTSGRKSRVRSLELIAAAKPKFRQSKKTAEQKLAAAKARKENKRAKAAAAMLAAVNSPTEAEVNKTATETPALSGKVTTKQIQAATAKDKGDKAKKDGVKAKRPTKAEAKAAAHAPAAPPADKPIVSDEAKKDTLTNIIFDELSFEQLEEMTAPSKKPEEAKAKVDPSAEATSSEVSSAAIAA